MCPVTMASSMLGLLAAIPVVGLVLSRFPFLKISRTRSAARREGTTTEEERLRSELLQAHRELGDLKEQVWWQTKLLNTPEHR